MSLPFQRLGKIIFIYAFQSPDTTEATGQRGRVQSAQGGITVFPFPASPFTLNVARPFSGQEPVSVVNVATGHGHAI